MQTNQNDNRAIELLEDIAKRLSLSYKTFDELSKADQRAVFMRAVDATPMSEIFEIEMTHEVCIERRAQIERAKQQARLDMAKQAGQANQSGFDAAVERVAKQLQNTVTAK